MAKYDFKCLNCGNLFTVEKSFSEIDKVKEKCPKCKKYKTKRIINTPSIIFKGDGFTKSNDTE